LSCRISSFSIGVSFLSFCQINGPDPSSPPPEGKRNAVPNPEPSRREEVGWGGGPTRRIRPVAAKGRGGYVVRARQGDAAGGKVEPGHFCFLQRRKEKITLPRGAPSQGRKISSPRNGEGLNPHHSSLEKSPSGKGDKKVGTIKITISTFFPLFQKKGREK